MPKNQELSLTAKVIWRVLFCSGIFALLFGVGIATAYINNIVQSQIYEFIGFTVIFLGIVFMAIGYLVSEGKIKISKGQQNSTF